jgi:hypothetical protein
MFHTKRIILHYRHWFVLLREFSFDQILRAIIHRSWDSSVSIVTRLLPGRPVFDFQHGQGSFFFQTGSEAHLATYQVVLGYFSLGIKRPGGEAGYSPPSSAEVKNPWSYASLSYTSKNRDRSVGMATGYGLDDWGPSFRFSVGAGNFCLHHRVQNGSGAHSASYPMGTGGLSLGVKRPGREADHSPSSSAKAKNA